jgi:hypothetical protein
MAERLNDGLCAIAGAGDANATGRAAAKRSAQLANHNQ